MFESLLHALAIDPVRDLLLRVDRTPIRSLLTRLSGTRQPDSTWTINRRRWRLTPLAFAFGSGRTPDLIDSNDKLLSRAPDVAESPSSRIRAEHDETRIIDQCDAERNARRDFGGRRAS
jgi:hypothetical protein